MPELRGDAVKMWDSTDHECILAGPAETGKTWAVVSKINASLWDNPGSQWVMLRKTYQSLISSVLRTYQRILGKDTPVKPYGGSRPEWYDYPNGSRLWLAGMDNPAKALSSERDGIYVNQAEELALDDWETLSTRVTGRGAVVEHPQLIGDCNPGPALHWIRQRASIRLLRSHHEDNPTLFTAEGVITEQGKRTISILDELTGARKERLRFGNWVGAEGMVYENWDKDVHLVSLSDLVAWNVLLEDERINSSVIETVIAGVDWGFTNPGCIQVYAVDGDGRAYLVHEVYKTGELIDWWVEQARYCRDYFGVQEFYADPSEPAYIQAFNNAGLSTNAADNDVAPGIQDVQRRLTVKEDTRARLYVYQGALKDRDPRLDERKKPQGFAEEVEGYVWHKAKDGRPQKEEPVKEGDHAMDTARYAIRQLDLGVGEVTKDAQETIAEWAGL